MSEEILPVEKLGVKELSEALVGLNELAVCLVPLLRDGAQLSDLSAAYENLWKNEEVKAKIQLAMENISAVPAEIKDVDLSEALELAAVQMSYVKKLIEVLKK